LRKKKQNGKFRPKQIKYFCPGVQKKSGPSAQYPCIAPTMTAKTQPFVNSERRREFHSRYEDRGVESSEKGGFGSASKNGQRKQGHKQNVKTEGARHSVTK